MTRFRRPAAQQRACLALLLALTLAVRVLVPTGWMITPGAGGAVLVPCSGVMPAATTPHAGMHHAPEDRSDHPAPEQPCAFAGLGIADTPATLPVLVAGMSPAPVAPRHPAAVTVGRGLAAPPPPATGPPAFA